MKTLIVVPAYNEEKSIGKVIRELSEAGQSWDILVINDCSTDKTSQITESSKLATIINLPCNLGIGGAVQTGFKYALRNNYDTVVQFDGDGQHVAREISNILEPLKNNQADLVIGSRFLKKETLFKSTLMRRIGIGLFYWLNSLLIGQKITDNTSGFRAYNQKVVEFLAVHYPPDYPEPESVILLGKNGFKIKEVPVNMRARQGGKSSISGLKSIYYMIKVTLSILVTSIRPRLIGGEK